MAEMSYADMTVFVQERSLPDLIRDHGFVSAVYALEEDDNTDMQARYQFLDVLTDKFHDYFSMNSKQRKSVYVSIMDRTYSLAELFTMFAVASGPGTPRLGVSTASTDPVPLPRPSAPPPPAGLQPASTAHAVTGVLGPYPVGSGRVRAQSLPPPSPPGITPDPRVINLHPARPLPSSTLGTWTTANCFVAPP